MSSFSRWCRSLDAAAAADSRSGGTSSLLPLCSVFEALKTLLQLYGTTCAPMLRQHGRAVLDFVLRRFRTAQVRCDASAPG